MEFQHYNVKIFVDGELAVDLERFIEGFHGWVAGQSMAEMMIDVADYRHVPDGPGVVIVGLEADYAIDNMGGRWGLRYNRKGAVEGRNADRLRQAFAAAAATCARLEAEFEGLRFSRQEFAIFVNDRALAPNNEETRSQLRAEIDSLVKEQLSVADYSAELTEDPRRLAEATVKLATPFDLDSAASRSTV